MDSTDTISGIYYQVSRYNSYILLINIGLFMFLQRSKADAELSNSPELDYPFLSAVDLHSLPIFDSGNCLIFITNFDQLDLISEREPSIIRDRSAPNHTNGWCASKSSNIFKFSARIRPWNCQVELDLFPPPPPRSTTQSDIFVSMLRCPVWKYPDPGPSPTEYGMVLPSRRPSIHILVVPSKHGDSLLPSVKIGSTDKSVEAVNTWIPPAYSYIDNRAQPINKILLLAEVTKANTSTYALSTLTHMTHSPNSDCRIWAAKEGHHLELFSYHSIKRKMSNVDVNWEIVPSEELKMLYTYFPRCEDYFPRDGSWKFRKAFSKAYSGEDAVISHVIIHTLLSISGNCSFYLSNDDHHLDNHSNPLASIAKPNRFVLVGRDRSRKIHLPIFIQDKQRAFRFVTCGSRGLPSYAFAELVSVYETKVWICLAFSLIALLKFWQIAEVSLGLGKSKTLKGLSLLKVLLEQGNPFQDNVFLSNQPNRVMLGIFLLVGIVMSNGYKNTNVYNIMAPRKPLVYEQLIHLINDNAKMYTRAKTVTFFRPEHLLANLRDRTISNYMIYAKDNIVTEYSGSNAEISRIFGGNWIPKYYESNETLLLNQILYNNSGLLKKNLLVVAISQFQSKREDWQAAVDTDWEAAAKELEERYHAIEHRQLLNELGGCHKSALVVPSDIAQTYAKYLRGKGGYVGKELYLQTGVQIHFKGMIPPQFIARLGYFKETGIMEKLMSEPTTKPDDIIDFGKMDPESFKSGPTSSGPIKASMKGNILVVFSVLSTGLITAIVGFLLELMWGQVMRFNA